jgi:ferrous iron transport protein A
MSILVPLSSLSARTAGTIAEIQPGVIAPKLVEMGLYPGCFVRVLFKAPFGGPLAVDLGSSVLSLRMDEADCVLLSNESLTTE